MVQINVSQQLKEPIGAVRNYTVNNNVDIADKQILVQGEVQLMRTDRGILAKGMLCTEIELTCGRCLSLFNYPITLSIEEEYLPFTDVVTGASLPLDDESNSFTINEQHVLDLTEAVRQYTMLATPMKPLCRVDCAGMCPNCGSNLNLVRCNCPPRPADPRWSKLNELSLS